MINKQKKFNLIIKKLNFNEFGKFKNFIIKNYKKNHILAKHKKLFNWFYKSKNNYNFLSAKYNNKIIGVIGFIPLKHFDHKLKNQFFFSLAVVAKKKIPGVFLKLIKKTKLMFSSNFVGVVGINKNLLNFHRWIGYNVNLMSHHFFQNSKKNNLILKKKYNYKSLIKKELDIIKISKNNLSLLDSTIFLNQTPKKSKNYLLNRYINNPFYDYKLYLIQKNKIKIILISRIALVKKVPIMRIVDLIYKNSDLRYVGNSIQKILEQNNCEYADLYSFGIDNKILNSCGFVNRYLSNEIIPEYFEPFVNKNIDLYSAYISNEKNIRLFKGDGDMDRPSKIL